MTTLDEMKPDAKRLLDAARDIKRLKNFADIARLLEESEQTLTNWKKRGVPKGKTVAICQKLGCRPEWLESGDGPMTTEPTNIHAAHPPHEKKGAYSQANVGPAPDVTGRIPLISGVQAGMWTDSVDIYEPGYAEQWLPHLKHNGEKTFALRVIGDSMTAPHGRSYPSGAIIFVDPDKRNPSSGDRIVAKLEGSQDTTFKVFVSEAGKCWLRPLNPQYPPILDRFTVVGTVTGMWIEE